MKYLHGCNYPWSTDGTTIFYGLDFGANVWGSHLGVSTRRAAVARDFEQMAALGFTVARWFVFCDGRAGIVYDDIGLPLGPDPHFFADLDAALEIARDAGIRLDLVPARSSLDVRRTAPHVRRLRDRRSCSRRGCRKVARNVLPPQPGATGFSRPFCTRSCIDTVRADARADLGPADPRVRVHERA